MTLDSSLALIDTHCHLNFDVYKDDLLQVLNRARERGILRILIPAVDIETSLSAIQISEEFDQVFAAVGVHPNSGSSWNSESMDTLKQLVSSPRVVAIGEIGLDYYRHHTAREIQLEIFRLQLHLAAELVLPVIIHNRDASDDLLSELEHWYADLLALHSPLSPHPGVIHSFSGSLELAQKLISLNFKLGINGPVTFQNAKHLQSVVGVLSLDDLLLETDAPFLTPHPFRGQRNEPANVRIVAEKIAALHSCSIDEVSRVTTEQANILFKWRKIH